MKNRLKLKCGNNFFYNGAILIMSFSEKTILKIPFLREQFERAIFDVLFEGAILIIFF